MSYLRRPVVLIALLACCASLALSACGSKSKSSDSATSAGGGTPTSTVSHANVKFALHAGLAFGAFHRYIYKPFKAGELQHPLQHKMTTLKAAAAAAFAYHELKLAVNDAQNSKELSHLVTPLNALAASITGIVSGIKHGGLSSGAIDGIESSIGSISGSSASSGTSITDVAHTISGL